MKAYSRYDVIPAYVADYSCKTQRAYKRLAPYAVDIEHSTPDKTIFLNDSPKSKLIPDVDFNIDDFIQSFAADTDLYSLIDKCIASGDMSYINKITPEYADVSMMPDNFQDVVDFVRKAAGLDLNALSKKLEEAQNAQATQAKQNADLLNQLSTLLSAQKKDGENNG